MGQEQKQKEKREEAITSTDLHYLELLEIRKLIQSRLLHSRKGSGEHPSADINALVEEASISPTTVRGPKSPASMSRLSAS
jgi:hypothetical protein